jgi:hypothetical protein
MRTLKLSDEQIELITQALGIAEKKYSDTHKNIVEDIILNRGNNEGLEQKRIASYYYVKSTEMAGLNQDIESGRFDI